MEYDGLTDAEIGLAHLMSQISETCYCAGWMADCEFDIWRLATEGGDWGLCDASYLPELAIIRTHAESIDRWIVWNESNDKDAPFYKAIPLNEWRPMYDAEMERRRAYREELAQRQASCLHPSKQSTDQESQSVTPRSLPTRGAAPAHTTRRKTAGRGTKR